MSLESKLSSGEQNTVDLTDISTTLSPAGSLGDLDGGDENTPDNLSLSGEDGGASDPDDSAEGDSSSPLPYTPLYDEGEKRKNAKITS